MIVQCHGHFDLLHYGHLKHLQAASKLCFGLKGNRTGELVVTLTAGRHMTKPGHPIFTDEQRLEMVGALSCVNSVIVIDSPSAEDAIEEVKPDIYVKGREYAERLPELQYCLDRGIMVMFLGEKIFGSTRLLNITGKGTR